MTMNFPRKRSKFREWSDARNEQIKKFNEARGFSYGPIEKQLDRLWHDMNDDIVPGKGGKFYTWIASKKAQIRPPFDIEEYQNYDFSQEEFEEDLD